MGSDDREDGAPNRSAIPLIGGAIVLAQLTMVRFNLNFSLFDGITLSFCSPTPSKMKPLLCSIGNCNLDGR